MPFKNKCCTAVWSLDHTRQVIPKNINLLKTSIFLVLFISSTFYFQLFASGLNTASNTLNALGPDCELVCDTIVLRCNEDASVQALGVPSSMDCDMPVNISHDDVFMNRVCSPTDTIIAEIRRTWIVEDALGFRDTCVQLILFERASIADVFIESILNVPCTGPNTDVSPTTIGGQPVIDGDLLTNGAACNLWVYPPTDAVVNGCGGTRTIQRTWVIHDSCYIAPDPNFQLEFVQLIEVEDNIPPVVSCADTIRMDTDPRLCTASFMVSNPTVVDACSAFADLMISIEIPGVGTGLGPHTAPPGTYAINYTVSDCSGSIETCSSTLIIEDNEEPNAICREFTVVSLNSSGSVEAYAVSFDEGSFDNCDNIGFLISRDMVNFDNSVTFNCDDVGMDSIMVVLRVFELLNPNQYSDCMMFVEVQDKLAPIITCPSDITIDCDEDHSDLSIYGQATAFDPCGFQMMEQVNDSTNQCGIGFIERVFITTDSSGNIGSCKQIITIENQTPFMSSQITWPLDTSFISCDPSIAPDDLLPGYDYPSYPSDDCASILRNYSDEEYIVSYPSCYKVFRKWKVLDWCTGDLWEHTQKIIIMDTEDPQINCPSDYIISASSNCNSTYVSLPDITANDCDISLTITNNSPYADAGGANASGNYPLGTTEITFRVEDNCGNVALCSVNIIVKDDSPPIPQIIHHLSIELGPIGNDVLAILDADSFNANSSDNCTDAEDLEFFIRRLGSGLTTVPTTTSITYDCDDIGVDSVEFWAVDAVGNSDYVIGVVKIQDNMQRCGGTRPSISGVLKTDVGRIVADAVVRLIAPNGNRVTTTDSEGKYIFEDLEPNRNYSVIPEKLDDLLDGVSTYDLVLISRHILNVEPLNDPLKLIAADVNGSGKVTTLDLLALRKVILRTNNYFPNNASWKFIAENFNFKNPLKPLAEPLSGSYNIHVDNGPVQANFTGVKIGDVNDNAGNNATGISNRSVLPELVLEIEDRHFDAGETVIVDFSTSQNIDLLSLQYAIHFNPEILVLEDYESGHLEGLKDEHFGWQKKLEGIFMLSWGNEEVIHLKAKETLYKLKFHALQNGSIAQVLTIAQENYPAEVYCGFDRPFDLVLDFVEEELTNKTTGFELYQNVPNPFNRSTKIGFNIPESGSVQLSIFDVSGKVVRSMISNFEAGYGSFEISADLLPEQGVYYYRLQTDKHTASKKMILL